MYTMNWDINIWTIFNTPFHIVRGKIWRDMNKHGVVIYIYLSNRNFQIQIISYMMYICWVIIQVLTTRKYPYYHPSQPLVLVNSHIFLIIMLSRYVLYSTANYYNISGALNSYYYICIGNKGHEATPDWYIQNTMCLQSHAILAFEIVMIMIA